MRRLFLTPTFLAIALGAAMQANGQFANTLFTENFNSLALKPSVNERLGFALTTAVATDPASNARPNAFTHTGPAGWTVDNNFDNFGNIDLTNAGGTPVFDQTKLPVEEELFRLGQVGVVVGNAGVPTQGNAADGVDEWEGWSFTNKNFWSSVDDQLRSSFTNASGNIAVADSDEFDDLGAGLGGSYYNSGMTTASIPTNGNSSLTLAFDSSWRAESYDDDHAGLGYAGNNQTAMVWATFNNGSQDFLPDSIWDSDAGHTSSGATDPIPTRPASPTYHADNPNESVSYSVPVPAGATSVKFTFAYLNAGNDWWWAVDNLKVSDGVAAPYWTEDFESVTLGDSVNERITNSPSHVTRKASEPLTEPRPDSYTDVPPAGWGVDNSGIPAAGLGNNDVGVLELEGWNFTTKEFWKFAGQSASRVDPFTKSDGILALADSDEYDDLNGGAGKTRPMDTILMTPTLDISAIAPGTLMLQFDSAWEPEDNQTAIVTVDYGSGEQEVLHWASSGDLKHDTNYNETVLLALNNPAGATSAKIAFKYLNAGNNWFWAIDNVAVGAGREIIPEPSSLALVALALAGLRVSRRRS